jgi:hypothetical protein
LRLNKNIHSVRGISTVVVRVIASVHSMTSFGRDATGFTDARRRDSMEENLFDFFDAPSGFSTRDVPVGGRSIREESFVDREPLTMTHRE